MDKPSDSNFQKPKPLPNPFLKDFNGIRPPYSFTPKGMLLPRELQPPPMYGPRGSTIPPKFLPNYNNKFKQNNNKYEKKIFYCETCDREFSSNDQFVEHKRSHRKCGVDGCSFYADPAIVAKHIEFQHKTGLFKKIKDLNSPEEIAKWCEERKKRYPTSRNIELRQKAQEEKFNRGERINEPRNRFGKNRFQHNNRGFINNQQRNNDFKNDNKFSGRGRNRKSNHNRKKFDRNNRVEITEESKQKVNEILVEETSNEVNFSNELNENLSMFRGTSQMVGYKVPVKKVATTNNPLSILAMYGSDSESNESTSDESEELKTNAENRNSAAIEAADVQNKTSEVIISEPHKLSADVEHTDINNKITLESINTTEDGTSISSDNESDQCMVTKILDSKIIQQPNFDLYIDQLSTPTKNKDVIVLELNEVSCSVQVEPTIEIELGALSGSDDEPEEFAIGKNHHVEIIQQQKSDLYLGESVSIPSTEQLSNSEMKKRSRKRKHKKYEKPERKTLLDYSKLRKYEPNTMLSKLLEPEIRHERNVLLQCVRFVVENDFFKIGQNKN